jgi:hypothetical protein
MRMAASRDSLRSAADEQPGQTKNRRRKSNRMPMRYGEMKQATRSSPRSIPWAGIISERLRAR